MVTSVVDRYYDPTTDQFLSVDPDVATTNQPYVFTNDDPLNAEDPTGLKGGGPTACVVLGTNGCNATIKAWAKAVNNSNEIFSVCGDGAIIMLCFAIDTNGKLYVSNGLGIGVPGISGSVTYTGQIKPSKVEKGLSATIEGSFWAGSGVTFSPSAKKPLLVIEIGTPGGGFFIMHGKEFG
jgi:hypothetical protein